MKLFKELAGWWPWLSPHTDYEEDAALYLEIIRRFHGNVRTAAEFGSGGGNNAFFLKRHFSVVLSDLSPEMLAVSRELNPELEHVEGDMRTVELGAQFDLVFIHDAITYFTSKEEVRRVLGNAKKHLNKSGILLVMPDHFKETFRSGTEHGGIDKDGRGMRYLEWSFDRDPDDHVAEVEYAYLMKERDGSVSRDFDHAEFGLFSMPEWEALFSECGFRARFERLDYPGLEESHFAIVGIPLGK